MFTSIKGKLKYATDGRVKHIQYQPERAGMDTGPGSKHGGWKRVAFFLELAFVVMGNLSSVRSLDRGDDLKTWRSKAGMDKMRMDDRRLGIDN